MLGLGDYGNGCHLLQDGDADESLTSMMIYGPDYSDWRDWNLNVKTQSNHYCRANTIQPQDIEDINKIYHPRVFGGLDFIEEPTDPVSTTPMLRLRFGLPPVDSNMKKEYNAYRYVVLHRAPRKVDAEGNPTGEYNSFTQLAMGSDPIVVTPEEIPKDEGSQYVLDKIDFNTPTFSSLRKTGHEFVLVGVTRGDPERDPSKILNPDTAAKLEHAVMSLDLNLNSNTGLSDPMSWTLGTPFVYVWP